MDVESIKKVIALAESASREELEIAALLADKLICKKPAPRTRKAKKPMHSKYDDVKMMQAALQMKHRGKSNSRIAKKLGIARGSVTYVLAKARAAGLAIEA